MRVNLDGEIFELLARHMRIWREIWGAIAVGSLALSTLLLWRYSEMLPISTDIDFVSAMFAAIALIVVLAVVYIRTRPPIASFMLAIAGGQLMPGIVEIPTEDEVAAYLKGSLRSRKTSPLAAMRTEWRRAVLAARVAVHRRTVTHELKRENRQWADFLEYQLLTECLLWTLTPALIAVGWMAALVTWNYLWIPLFGLAGLAALALGFPNADRVRAGIAYCIYQATVREEES